MMNEYTFDEIQPGMTVSFSKIINPEMEDLFRKITGDNNPLHRDDEFAREISNNKFGKHATFGMLTASLYSTLAGMYMPGKYSLIHSFDEISFIKPVYLGDTLNVQGVVDDVNPSLKLIQLKCKITNQNNKLVSRAKMKVFVLK